jgi:2'-5' RNA ligase
LPVGAYSFKILTIAVESVKKRLFIAVDISNDIRAAVEMYINKLAGRFREIPAKWERPEKLHLTLKFLGTAKVNVVDDLTDLIRRNAELTKPFDIEIAGTGAFPSNKNPRVLWLGVREPLGRMKDLAERIDQDCVQLGFDKETRSFKPHLTIARIRDPRVASDLSRVHADISFGPFQFNCDEVSLYESQPGRGGSTYIKLETAKFGGT